MRLKTIYPILLLLAGSVAILQAAAIEPGKEPTQPLQPFLVELLDQERGHWNFLNSLGQQLALPGNVSVVAAVAPEKAKTAVLRLDDPEFPGDWKRAEFREFPATKPGVFELRSGGFRADLFLKPDGKGTLSNIKLGSAMEANRIPAALYVSDGVRMIPVRLEGKNGGLKLQSDRVGSVFVGSEPVNLHAVRLDGGAPAEAEYIITDYFRNREVGRGKIRLEGEDTVFPVPLEKFGSFTVMLKLPERSATLRVTHIPEPQKLDPERSFVGMNIFQQQMWYYSYQLPLFAQAGVRWIRPWLAWENTWKMQEPNAGEFHTKQLDVLLRRLMNHNQKLVYILYSYSPALKLPSARFPMNDTQMKRWQEYVKRIVAHCSEVDDWEVWNEPDNSAKDKTGFDAFYYNKLLHATASAVRSVRPDARIHALSHSRHRSWLSELCKDTSAAAVSDVVTLHTYAASASFTLQEMSRQQILDIGGFCGKPQQFNEIGATAYDGCPDYQAAYPEAKEYLQAETLLINWAQALYFGGPQGKAFWFCSLDPRDSTNPKQRTEDSGFGLLYLGLQPKTAYAALAGMANLLDGHECLGQRGIHDTSIRYIVFSGGRAVVWSDTRKGTIKATALGCTPGEKLTVFDLFGNPIKNGKAEELTLTLDDGPRFLLGCSSLESPARTAREEWMHQRTMTGATERQVGMPILPELKIGELRKFEFIIPEKSHVTWETSRDFPAKLECRQERERIIGEVTAGTKSGSGFIKFSVQMPDAKGMVVNRVLPVSVARRNFIPDGSFESGNLNAFLLIPQIQYDGTIGAEKPGCLRFIGPFAGRLHLYAEHPLLPGHALHFKAKVRGRLAPETKISFNVAMFGKRGWLETWTAASLQDDSPDSRKFRPFTAEIPNRIEDWTSLTATLPGSKLPEEHISLVFFIDCRGGSTGDFLLIDDLELYQNESETGEEEKSKYIAIPWKKWELQRKQGLSLIPNGNLWLEPPLSVRLYTVVDPTIQKFRFRIRSRLDATTQVKLALACFDGKRYLGDRILAATSGNAVSLIPRQSNEWTELSGDIPQLPEKCSHCLVFVDGNSGQTEWCEISPIELLLKGI